MFAAIHHRLATFAILLAMLLALAAIIAHEPVAQAQPATKAVGKQAATKDGPKKPDPTDEFFEKGIIPSIRIDLTKEEEQKLRGNQRAYVLCTLTVDGTKVYKNVRVKLKGAAGSFRNFDDRPALTLNMDKDDRFYGLDKFHLNNSVQDESYMSELICAKTILAAGYPATRASHARVWLNGRDLGFYGLKEGFDNHFLKRHFAGAKGNLYDGGFCQDIDANLELDEGPGPEGRADLKALIAACREGDQTKKWARVEELLDIDAFLKFTALELMMCHWDGYVQNRNNYRVYFRSDDKKAVFFLHGMDQMFGDVNFSVFHVPGPIVANAVLSNPAWRERYREIVREMLPHFAPEKLHAHIDEAHKRIRPVVAGISEDRARHLDDRVRDFRGRMNERQKRIIAQFPPEPIAFTKEGFATLEGWQANAQGDAKLEIKKVAGRDVLVLETGPSNNCDASFRTTIRLAKGKYRIEGRVRTVRVAGTNDARGGGAGIRLSGGNRDKQVANQATGTADWRLVHLPIEITEELKEVVIVAELRSTAGTAFFDATSLRVVKVK